MYIEQVLNGLKYLHSEGIIHRDIKAANILITTNDTIKLADFGIAVQDNNNENNVDVLNEDVYGSLYWMAPEIMKRNGVTISDYGQ